MLPQRSLGREFFSDHGDYLVFVKDLSNLHQANYSGSHLDRLPRARLIETSYGNP